MKIVFVASIVLLSFSASINILFASDIFCSGQAVAQKYAKTFGHSKKQDLKLIRIDRKLANHINAIFIANENSCGSRGCEYQIYSKENKCFKYLGSFTGHFKISKKQSNYYSDIIVEKKDTYLSNKQKITLAYSKIKKIYVEKN